MKKLVYLFLLLVQSLSGQITFQNANDLYKNEQYQKAVLAYENILQSGRHSAELYFNLGNAYYKMHKVAPAIYNYEKALLLVPNDLEVQTNLKFAQKRAIDEIKVVPKVGFSKMLNDVLQTFHYNTWAVMATAFSMLFLLFFVGYYFGSTTLVKRLFFIGMFFALLLVVLSFFSAIMNRNNYKKERPAIVFSEVTVVKNEPKSTAPTAFELHEGAKVYVLETRDNWCKIELTDETLGWIEKTAIKELKVPN